MSNDNIDKLCPKCDNIGVYWKKGHGFSRCPLPHNSVSISSKQTVNKEFTVTRGQQKHGDVYSAGEDFERREFSCTCGFTTVNATVMSNHLDELLTSLTELGSQLEPLDNYINGLARHYLYLGKGNKDRASENYTLEYCANGIFATITKREQAARTRLLAELQSEVVTPFISEELGTVDFDAVAEATLVFIEKNLTKGNT